MASLQVRLAGFMEEVAWEGHTNWRQVQDSVLQKYIPEVKQWIRQNLKYVRHERSREVIRTFFFEGGTVTSKGGDATYLDYGRAALWALYQKERDNG